MLRNRRPKNTASIECQTPIDGRILKQKDEIISNLRNELEISKCENSQNAAIMQLKKDNKNLRELKIELEHGVGELYTIFWIFRSYL